MERPYSPHFSEHYWSPAGGPTEKDAIFIQGSQLPPRLAALGPGQIFTVAELGFGTGLTAALTAGAFHRYAPPHATLHYVDYESHPLPLPEFESIHATLPAELNAWLAPLRSWWPTLQPGWNSITIGHVTLWLWYGEALAGIGSQPHKADAWYLDGFSPLKNPSLWSLPLLQQVAAHSNPGATVASYSVATMVRENLTQAGFIVAKQRGVPPKRKRLSGYLRPPAL